MEWNILPTGSSVVSESEPLGILHIGHRPGSGARSLRLHAWNALTVMILFGDDNCLALALLLLFPSVDDALRIILCPTCLISCLFVLH